MYTGLNNLGLNSISSVFSPTNLFINNEQGFLYINDISTMYQDSAGTIPAVLEQPVGKWLDQSGRGNHATQPTSANRPTVTARYNVATNSEFALGALGAVPTDWVERGTVTGRLVADVSARSGHALRITAAASGGVGATDDVRLTTISGLVVGATYKVAVSVKAGPGNTGGAMRAVFAGATLDAALNAEYTTFSFNATPSATAHSLFFGASGVACVADVQLVDVRLAVHAIPGIPAYQRVNTATDYDSVGFPVRLKTNGTNQWMQTGSVDFTGTDKMTVFAGVTKLSDAALAMLVESSIDSFSNNGAFSIRAPQSVGTYAIGDRGATTGQVYSTPANFPAAISNVLAVSLDHAGATAAAQLAARVNGVGQTLSPGAAGPTGAGAFGNYPVFVGARTGGSLFFSGDIYCLSARGAQTTDSLIAQMEQWANGRMGRVY